MGSVSDVISLHTDQIKPAPELGSIVNTDPMMDIDTISQRMPILVDIERLMPSAEMGLIKNIAA